MVVYPLLHPCNGSIHCPRSSSHSRCKASPSRSITPAKIVNNSQHVFLRGPICTFISIEFGFRCIVVHNFDGLRFFRHTWLVHSAEIKPHRNYMQQLFNADHLPFLVFFAFPFDLAFALGSFFFFLASWPQKHRLQLNPSPSRISMCRYSQRRTVLPSADCANSVVKVVNISLIVAAICEITRSVSEAR